MRPHRRTIRKLTADLQFFQPLANSPWKHHSTLCHPDRRGGTCSFPPPATKLGCPICPDFLRRLVALIYSMRLSLMKGAHAALPSTAWQEIGVKPSFGLSGIPQHSTRLFVIPERSRGICGSLHLQPMLPWVTLFHAIM